MTSLKLQFTTKKRKSIFYKYIFRSRNIPAVSLRNVNVKKKFQKWLQTQHNFLQNLVFEYSTKNTVQKRSSLKLEQKNTHLLLSMTI